MNTPPKVGDARYVVVGCAHDGHGGYDGPPFAVRREFCVTAPKGVNPALWARQEGDEYEVHCGDDRKAAERIAQRLNSGRRATFTEMGGSRARKSPVLTKQCEWCLGFVQVRRVGNARAFHAKFKKLLREHSETCWPAGLRETS